MPGFWRLISIGADLRPPKWEASAHEQAEIWWLINPKPWNELLAGHTFCVQLLRARSNTADA